MLYIMLVNCIAKIMFDILSEVVLWVFLLVEYGLIEEGVTPTYSPCCSHKEEFVCQSNPKLNNDKYTQRCW